MKPLEKSHMCKPCLPSAPNRLKQMLKVFERFEPRCLADTVFSATVSGRGSVDPAACLTPPSSPYTRTHKLHLYPYPTELVKNVQYVFNSRSRIDPKAWASANVNTETWPGAS